MREFALRALADRKGWASRVPMEPFVQALTDPSERVQVAARVGLGRIGKKSAGDALLQTPVPSSWIAPAIGTEGLHASPNASIIPAHVAVRALVELNAVDACVAAIGSDQSDLALWALRYMHDPKAIVGLIAAYKSTDSPALQNKIITTLSRLYHQEAPYDGSWWWSTRPDTRGPYYKGIPWGQSPVIEAFLLDIWETGNAEQKALLTLLNGRHRMKIEAFGDTEELLSEQKSEVELGAIANKKGQVSRASIEDVMLALADLKGDPATGKKLFTQQGCMACHSLEKGEPMKGPFMGQIGAIMNRDQIAESILKPNASISQGFASVLIMAKGDKSYVGFVSEETADRLTLRNVAGNVFNIEKADVLDRKELPTSMMPPGLANSLSFEEFASLVDFLAAQKK